MKTKRELKRGDIFLSCMAEYALAHEWHIPCRDKVFELGWVHLRGVKPRKKEASDGHDH